MFCRIFLNRLLLALLLLALPTLACDLSSLLSLANKQPTPASQQPTVVNVINIVTNAVTAKNVIGDTFEPSGITDSFPANQDVFHTVVTIANAPVNTKIKVSWFTADKTPMGEYEITSDGSRNLDFTFQPDAGKLPAGNYIVQVYVNGNLDRALNFSVQAGAVAIRPTAVLPTAVAKPTTVPPTVARPEPKPSGYVNSVTMAEGVQGANKDPLNPTVVFKPSATFHAVVRTQNAPANTKFTATWYVADVGTVVAPNSLIDETELATDGSRNIDFTLAPNSAWPSGSYRVEVSVNGVLDTIKTFSVSGSSSGQSIVVPPTVPASTPVKPTATQAKPAATSTSAGLTCGNGTLSPGMVGVYVTNNFDGELLFAIASRSYKIPGHGTLLVQVPGGTPFTYSATITGVGTLTAGPYTFDPGTCVPFTPQK